MLAGARLGDDARLAHAADEQALAERVVDLVRAGVRQVFSLEVDPGAAEVLRQAAGEVERRRPAHIVAHEVGQLLFERWIGARRAVGGLEFSDGRHQRFGDVLAAVRAEATALVGASGARLSAHFADLWRRR